MSKSMSKHGLVRRGLRTLALVGSALALIHAAPARANNDFLNGFEDQLGRIVATQVFAIGAPVAGPGQLLVAVRALKFSVAILRISSKTWS